MQTNDSNDAPSIVGTSYGPGRFHGGDSTPNLVYDTSLIHPTRSPNHLRGQEMKKLAILIILLTASTISLATTSSFVVTGINVKKAPNCTIAEFTTQVTNYGGIQLVKAVQSNEVATVAVVDLLESFTFPTVFPPSPTVNLSTRTTLLTAALAKIYLASTVEVSSSPSAVAILKNVYDEDINTFKKVLVQNGGCAIFAGVSVPVERY